MPSMRCMIVSDECRGRAAAVGELDTIDRRGDSAWYQPWDRAGRRDDRRSGFTSGSVQPRQYPVYRRYDHLYHDHAPRVPGIDAVSQLAAHAYEISSSINRSLSDFFVNRGNVHAICTWTVA